MSEQTQILLLDSSTYFRLAQSIHPLLHGSVGDAPRYILCVHADLDKEYGVSSRLKNKFEWVRNSEYVRDRENKRCQAPRKKQPDAERAYNYLASHAKSNNLNVSRADLKALATGFVMGIPVVMDDGELLKVAGAFEIECWSTIKLLKLMVTAGRVDMDKVKEILEYWDHENDLPMSKEKLRRVFRQYFNDDCPI